MQIIRFGNFSDKQSGRPSNSTFREAGPIRIHTSKCVLFYSLATKLLYLSAFDIDVFPARDGIHTSLLRFWAMPPLYGMSKVCVSDRTARLGRHSRMQMR